MPGWHDRGMEEQARGQYRKLSRQDASDAVTGLGWRLVLGELRTEVQTGSLPLAADVAARAATVPGADGHLRLDVRADRVIASLQTAAEGWVTERDVELARKISTVVEEFRLDTVSGGEAGGGARAVGARRGRPDISPSASGGAAGGVRAGVGSR